MLMKLIVSFFVGIIAIYLLFCLLILNLACSDGSITPIAADIKHRWFWVMSMYIGIAVVAGVILTIIIGAFYLLIYGFN